MEKHLWALKNYLILQSVSESLVTVASHIFQEVYSCNHGVQPCVRYDKYASKIRNMGHHESQIRSRVVQEVWEPRISTVVPC